MKGKIKHDDDNTEKRSLDLLFLSSQKKNTCKILSREIGGKKKHNWFLDYIQNKTSEMSNQT